MPGIRYRPTSKKFTIGRTLHSRKVQAQCSFPGTSLFVQRCAMHAQTLNCGTERQHAHSSQRRMMWTAEDIRPHYLAALRNTLKKEITQNDVGRRGGESVAVLQRKREIVRRSLGSCRRRRRRGTQEPSFQTNDRHWNVEHELKGIHT